MKYSFLFFLSLALCSFSHAESSKKVLFIMGGFSSLGGTERAFLNMTNSLEISDVQYELCILKRGGVLEPFLRKDLKIVSWEKARAHSYDVAISYDHGVGPRFWAHRIKAKKKVQWIHTDLRGAQFNWTPTFSRAWNKIDTFVCVSDKSQESFQSLYPKLSKRCIVINNIIDNAQVRTLAKAPIQDMPKEDGLLTMVSVCRLAKPKALERTIRVHKRLDDEGIHFRWYIIGDGDLKSDLEKLIRECHLEGKCILLGSRLNPYPYMQKADLFALLSYVEGFPLALIEAKILSRPIIATNFSGAKDLIHSGRDGLIVDNNEEAIYQGLKRLILSRELRHHFSNTLKGFEYDNSPSLEKIEKLIFSLHNSE
jgi:glycosyltransferase involved in cell wall biosynthesis